MSEPLEVEEVLPPMGLDMFIERARERLRQAGYSEEWLNDYFAFGLREREDGSWYWE